MAVTATSPYGGVPLSTDPLRVSISQLDSPERAEDADSLELTHVSCFARSITFPLNKPELILLRSIAYQYEVQVARLAYDWQQ